MNAPLENTSQPESILFSELRHLLNDAGVSDDALREETRIAHSFLESQKLTAGVVQKYGVHLYVSADGKVKTEKVQKLAETITQARQNLVQELEEATRLKAGNLV